MIFRATMYQWSAHAPKDFQSETIHPIPCAHAPFVVTIAQKPYAGFLTRQCAEEAIRMWAGESNGCGIHLPAEEREHAGWRAVRGIPLAIIERGAGSVGAGLFGSRTNGLIG
jgi:hypothetical protein